MLNPPDVGRKSVLFDVQMPRPKTDIDDGTPGPGVAGMTDTVV